jgi:hypothetical protein
MRRYAAPTVLASALALGAGLIVGPSATAAVSPATSPALVLQPAGSTPTGSPTLTATPRADYLGITELVIVAADAISQCSAFTNQGLKCDTSPSVADVSKQLNQIEAQIAQNQDQTMKALDSLQNAIDAQDLTKAVKDLSPVSAHIGEAGKAWDALSQCANAAGTAGAKCTGYAGVRLPNVPVAEGLTESREFFINQMDKISLTLEQAAQFFAGVQGQPSVGLLHNLWKVAKRQQDRDSGAASPGQLPLQPVVVTNQLSRAFLPVMTYYRDMMYLYGALRPAAQKLKGKSSQARSEAALADQKIFSDSDRYTVAGAFAFYRIPDVSIDTIAYVGSDGKLYKIVKGEGRGAPLTSSTLMEVADRIKAYGYNADTMAKDPSLLPDRGRFGVWEKVKHRTYKEYSGKYAICAGVGGFGCPATTAPGVLRSTFEIGHRDAVGSKDKYGNVMKMQWVPMRVLSVKATWARLIAGQLDLGGSCFGATLKGEPPYGVWNVQFLDTFRRTVEYRHAMFEWEWVTYGDRVVKCVGPGVYVSQPSPVSAVSAFSVIDQGTPAGILVKPSTRR